MLTCILCPLVCAAGSLACVQAAGRRADREFLRRLVLLLCGEAFLCLLLMLAAKLTMYVRAGVLPIGAVLTVSLLPDAALTADYLLPGMPRLCRYLRRLAWCAAVLLAAETLLFHLGCIDLHPHDTILAPQDLEVTGSARVEGAVLVIDGDAAVTLGELPDDTGCLVLSMRQQHGRGIRPFRVKTEMEDDNFRYEYQTVGDTYCMAYDRDETVRFFPYGTLYSVKLSFSEVRTPVRLSRITALRAVPYDFSQLRYFGLLGIAALLILLRCFSLLEIAYDPKRLSHRIAAAVMTLLCLAGSAAFWIPVPEAWTTVPYKKGADMTGYDVYAQTFAALREGRVQLGYEVDPALAALENPYDKSARETFGVESHWDCAYYDGAYYNYFGIAPVLTYYQVFYALHGDLPTVEMTVMFFSVLAILMLCLCIPEAARIHGTGSSLVLLLGAMPAAVCLSGVLFCLEYPDKYYLAVSAGLAFLFLSLWAGMRGARARRLPVRCLLFAVSGAALALCAGSRPTQAVNAAFLLPLFWEILGRQGIGRGSVQAASFLLPLGIGIAGLLAYNHARFGSPLEFGAVYQITVGDIHANRLRLSLLPEAVYHYFLHPIRTSSVFPYVELYICDLHNYGAAFYNAAAVGSLWYPILPAGLCCAGAAFRRSTKLTRRTLAVCLAVPLLLSWIDCCMAGVNERYLIDTAALLSLGAPLLLLCGTGKSPLRRKLALGSELATLAVMLLILVSLRDQALLWHQPWLYDAVREAAGIL